MSKFISLLIVFSLTSIVACGVSPVRHHSGPPPHAPAHGYRHNHHNHNLEFHNHLGVYAVIGFHDLYFYDGHYIRFIDDNWRISASSKGPWKKAKNHQIHDKLRKSKMKKSKNKNKKDKKNKNKKKNKGKNK